MEVLQVDELHLVVAQPNQQNDEDNIWRDLVRGPFYHTVEHQCSSHDDNHTLNGT